MKIKSGWLWQTQIYTYITLSFLRILYRWNHTQVRLTSRLAFLHSALWPLKLIQVVTCIICSTLLQYSIPLHGSQSFIHSSLKDIWFASSFGLLQIKLLKHSDSGLFCARLSFHFFRKIHSRGLFKHKCKLATLRSSIWFSRKPGPFCVPTINVSDSFHSISSPRLGAFNFFLFFLAIQLVI